MMKKAIIALAALAAAVTPDAGAREFVIVHTNDTHSQLDPTEKDLGGIQRRKVLVDSIRAAHPGASLLVDAGDAVQGTLYFTLYGGKAEMEMMNALGYDLAILGNHDFDNGAEALADMLKLSRSTWISTNYDFRGNPALDSIFTPYKVVEAPDGKRVAFMGLNLDPKGMIADGNYDGVRYLDAVKAANSTAWVLKNLEEADVVVAISHLGYDGVPFPSDRDIAAASEDIDIILGGHSHTNIVPGTGAEWVDNANGRPVLITQSSKSGVVLSEVVIDLDSIGTALPVYRKHAIDKRLDAAGTDPEIAAVLAKYRQGVDDMMNLKIGRSARELSNDEAPLLNFVADFCRDRGNQLLGRPVDLALMNKGSLRRSLPKGDITQGEIISMQPFTNRVVVLRLSGKDLMEAFDVMATRDGDGVSSEVKATYDPATRKCVTLTINGKPVDPEATYSVATIDYLAHGGDYMEPLTRGAEVAASDNIVYDDLIAYIKARRNKPINPSPIPRMTPVK